MRTTAGDENPITAEPAGAAGVRRRRLCAPAWITALFWLVLALPAHAADPTEPTRSDETSSETEINKKVTDPVSTTWSLKVQNNLLVVDVDGHGDRAEDTIVFQPSLPVWLTPDLKFIPRPKFTLLNAKPYADSQGALHHAVGFGDTVLDTVLSPKLGPWLLALGPTFVFPTATSDRTGQGQWQIGPASVFGYRAKTWLAGLIEQQWWSFAGSASRPSVSQLNLQYIASYFFGQGWSIGTSPTVKVDWRASSGNQVTFPIGPTLGRVVKFGGTLPVKFELQLLYFPVHPEQNGTEAQVQLNIIPVVPGLLHGLVLGGGPPPDE